MLRHDRFRHLGVLATSLLGLASCGDLLETGGNSETGRFEIQPEARVAVGGWLTYTVRDWEIGSDGAGIGFQLLSASNDAAARIRSMTTLADLVVDGLADGTSRIEFRARADGDSIADAFTLGAETVTRLSFLACRSGGLYVRGSSGRVLYEFNPGGPTPVRGMGLYPVAAQPAEAVTLMTETSTAEHWVFAVAGTAPAQVTLVSTLPGDAAQYTMNVIDASAVDGVTKPTSSTGYASSSTTFDVLPTAAGQPVCVSRRVVASTTPFICALRRGDSDVSSLDVGDESVKVHFLRAGVCTITVTFPELGKSFTLPSWTVSEPSSGGGGDDDDWDD